MVSAFAVKHSAYLFPSIRKKGSWVLYLLSDLVTNSTIKFLNKQINPYAN